MLISRRAAHDTELDILIGLILESSGTFSSKDTTSQSVTRLRIARILRKYEAIKGLSPWKNRNTDSKGKKIWLASCKHLEKMRRIPVLHDTNADG